jgi:acyl carrier protein
VSTNGPLQPEAIRRVIVEALAPRAQQVGLAPEAIDGDLDILGSGLVDSLAFVELLLGVEASLGHPIELERLDFVALTSLDNLVDQIHSLQAEATAGL